MRWNLKKTFRNCWRMRLLDAGWDPDETGQGVLSGLCWFSGDVLPVTPVMAAVYYGQAETARQLLDAGAVCDFSHPLFCELLKRGNRQTLEVAEQLSDVGFEQLPAEVLESLREEDCA